MTNPAQAAWPKMIHHQFEILASREIVFRALMTVEGLSGWWTTNVGADEPAIGSLVHTTFRGAFNPQMRITELDPPARVRWDGAGGHAAWGETTTIRFELDETTNGTLVRFWHRLGLEVSMKPSPRPTSTGATS